MDGTIKQLCVYESKAALLFSIVSMTAEIKRFIQKPNKILCISYPTGASAEAEEQSAVLCRVKQPNAGGWGWKVAAGQQSSSSQYQCASWLQSLSQTAFSWSAYSLFTDHQIWTVYSTVCNMFVKKPFGQAHILIAKSHIFICLVVFILVTYLYSIL